MNARWCLLLAITASLGTTAGCISAKAPENIDVRVGSSRPEPVDSSRVPNPQTLEEARQELHKAYANIQYLERKVAKLEDDKAEYKHERDKYKKKLEKYEDD